MHGLDDVRRRLRVALGGCDCRFDAPALGLSPATPTPGALRQDPTAAADSGNGQDSQRLNVTRLAACFAEDALSYTTQ